MRQLFVLALVSTLAACSAERAPVDAPATPDVAATPPPASTAPPASAPPAVQPPTATTPAANGDGAQATFAGIGGLAFGTPAAQMEQAWGSPLKAIGKEDNADCYFMSPASVAHPADFHFMVGSGRFARFGTSSDRVAAPGGGRVGMTEAQLQALYGNGLTASPHFYTDGKYLEIAASGVAPTRLVFETDEAGKVTEWRLGLEPEVGYVEGCS